MSLSTSTFKTRFPEFASVDDAVVQAALDEALLSIDATVWGEKASTGQGLTAAQILALSPFGLQANLGVAKDDGFITVYDKRLDDLRQRVGTAYRAVLP